MTRFSVPFGKTKIEGEIDSSLLSGVYESGVSSYHPAAGETELLKAAFDCPIASPPLEELAAKARTALIIASDHTRPVPSKVIFPELLRRIRNANPGIELKILIATGCHRGTARDELVAKFGREIVDNEKILIHDCRDESALADLGHLPSGGEFKINRAAVETDLLLSEGFIEPHFFAGFSGGRKSILPGIAGERTVMGNHCAEFISSPYARAGVLENNPLHRDMLYAAETAGLKFIINVVINAEKQVIHVVAGDPVKAHLAGCEFLKDLCRVKVPEPDIVITSNGGYPLDQNIYQAVKGMSAAETVCRPGGVIIMSSACSDGHGGESFYRQISEAVSPAELLRRIEAVPQDKTLPDQWEAQILARILSRFRVIMVSDPEQKKIIRDMRMEYAASLTEAIARAFEISGKEARLAVIPDGVAVIAEKINSLERL
ncbi:MAG: lactate racemization operon protein LarA [Lentisphaerae bacterium GWF2_44_16]|nr:MAG: lactate racemization operon protein LarA [Lentisphaerae bacterium GWF2_44_16]